MSIGKQKLSKVYNRGFWDGYYLGRKMGEWSNQYGSVATQKKVYLGKGIKYFEKIGVGEFLLESQEINLGDQLIITGPTTGYVEAVAEEIRNNEGNPITTASRGETIAIRVAEKIRPSDKLYKIVSAHV